MSDEAQNGTASAESSYPAEEVDPESKAAANKKKEEGNKQLAGACCGLCRAQRAPDFRSTKRGVDPVDTRQ